MDELTLLREHNNNTAAPDPEVLAVSRRALEVAMTGIGQTTAEMYEEHRDGPTWLPRQLRSAAKVNLADAKSSHVRKRRFAVGAITLIAACSVAALVATGVLPVSSANAAETLRTAATEVSAAPSLRLGVSKHVLQFVHSSSRSAHLGGRGQAVSDQSVLVEWTQTLRPTSGDSGWVRTWTKAHAINSWGTASKELLDSTNKEATKPQASYLSTSNASDFWDGPTPAEVRALSRNPRNLLKQLSNTASDLNSVHTASGRAFFAALSVLGSGLADNQLQAAIYRALGLLPDLHASRGADIDGRAGIAIASAVRQGGDELKLIIDPSTGQFLGYTETHSAPTSGAPAGSIEYAAAYYFGR